MTGEEYDDAVANLMAMGFDRNRVVRALQASFNNPERAAEYLFTVSHRGRSYHDKSIRVLLFTCTCVFVCVVQ